MTTIITPTNQQNITSANLSIINNLCANVITSMNFTEDNYVHNLFIAESVFTEIFETLCSSLYEASGLLYAISNKMMSSTMYSDVPIEIQELYVVQENSFSFSYNEADYIEYIHHHVRNELMKIKHSIDMFSKHQRSSELINITFHFVTSITSAVTKTSYLESIGLFTEAYESYINEFPDDIGFSDVDELPNIHKHQIYRA